VATDTLPPTSARGKIDSPRDGSVVIEMPKTIGELRAEARKRRETQEARRKLMEKVEKWSESDPDDDDPCAVIYMRCKACKTRVGAHSRKESMRCGLI